MYTLRSRSVPESAGVPAPRRPASWTRPPWVSLRVLKMVGFVLPIVFVLGLELIRFGVVEADLTFAHDRPELTGHAALALLTVICVVVFASTMFYFIDRAQGQVVRQNRQLEALTAISTAVRGDLSVDSIIDQALDGMLVSAGAVSASIALPGHEGHEGGRVRARFGLPDPGGQVLDIALTAGTSSVGTLTLHLASGQARPDGLTTHTLQAIGQQVAHAIQRAQLVGDLQRGQLEGHALYEVLLRISNQHPLTQTLDVVVRHARDLLASRNSGLCLDDAASRIVLLEGMLLGTGARGEGPVCITPDGMVIGARPTPDLDVDQVGATLVVPIGSPGATVGELWVGRDSGRPFTERDRRFLVTLAELASIALAGARMRENERHGAILAERERIARELHDSLAQVLGVTHLRLQALRGKPFVRSNHSLDGELAELAGISQEAYRDVREAILGLGQSAATGRSLADSLAAYLAAFSRQSGIATELECEVEDLVLLPRCEVQVIRVIQEALTNARKHSGAAAAVVRITESRQGVRFVVEDDGGGFDPDTVPAGRDGFGFGLSAMQERVRLVGGALTLDSAPGRGTRIVVDVPVALVQRRPSSQVAVLGGGTRGA